MDQTNYHFDKKSMQAQTFYHVIEINSARKLISMNY